MKMTFGRLGTVTLAVIAATAMLGSDSVRAEEGDHHGLPALKPYVGAFAGLHVVAGNWDLGRDADSGVSPESGVVYGVRGGLQVTYWFGFEGEIGFVPVDLGDQGDGLAMAWNLNTLWSPLDFKLSPYVLLGIGMYQATGDDLGLDADWDFHWGLGLRAMLTDWVDFRIEGRHVVTDSYTSGLASNFLWTLGVEFFF